MPTLSEKIAAAVESGVEAHPEISPLVILDLVCIGVEIGQAIEGGVKCER